MLGKKIGNLTVKDLLCFLGITVLGNGVIEGFTGINVFRQVHKFGEFIGKGIKGGVKGFFESVID